MRPLPGTVAPSLVFLRFLSLVFVFLCYCAAASWRTSRSTNITACQSRPMLTHHHRSLKRALYLDPFEWIISYNLGDQTRPHQTLILADCPAREVAGALWTEARKVCVLTITSLTLDPPWHSGLVHLNTGQYASAFHYLSASINLKPVRESTATLFAHQLTRTRIEIRTSTTYTAFTGFSFVVHVLGDCSDPLGRL